jgi:pyruvate/2-oxoglutarate dehydrogenase complex dihydrolipoamide dehydrogenase (E3) component
MAEVFDVVVIGAGSAGENAADRAHRGGLEVALVEADLVGGECSYWACMPSKALLRPGEVLAAARRVPGARRAVAGGVDAAATLATRDEVVNRYDDRSQVDWVVRAGVNLVRGRARFVGERRVKVEGGPELEARRAVVLATGSSPVVPPVDGLREAEPWTSRDATAVKDVPRRLAVLGGGVVACELAQAFRSLGTEEVTIVEKVGHLLPKEEPFAGRQLMDAFDALGITVRCGRSMTEVRRSGGVVTVTLDDGSTVTADEILVATGRRPNVAGLGLETIGLAEDVPLQVDEHLQVRGVPWLYAVGDVNGKALLTHMGKHQARIAGDHIAGKDVADTAPVARVIFTDPQVAAVGRTEAQARTDGVRVRVVQVELASVGGARILGEDVQGTAHLVVDEDRRVVVGATFTGPGVGEMLHAATVAIAGEVPLDRLWQAVPSYPTVSEIWLRLLEAYGL